MQVIAFISGKGGVGKSSLTANVAAGLATRKKSVLVVDLDPQNMQRIHLGLDPHEVAGLSREGLHSDGVFESPFDVHFVPYGSVPEGTRTEFEAYLRENPLWLRDSIASLEPDAYNFVLIDTPPGGSVYLQQALRAAHRAVIVVLPDAASMSTLPRTLRLVEEITAGRPDFEGCHLVINQMPHGSKLAHHVQKTIQMSYPELLTPVTIPRDTAVQQALAYERPVLQYELNCPASLALQGLADWLIDGSDE